MKSLIVLYEPPKRARTDYRIGLSAWTDKSLLDEATFYPRNTMTAEERLWWYSHFFDAVEVTSSFYAIPSAATTALWARRTPPGFMFNAKAYGLLTGHYLDVAQLPDALKKMLPRTQRARPRVPSDILGSKARSWAFGELRKGLQPLQLTGKLGYVLFELARSLTPTDETLSYLTTLPHEIPYAAVAVEFRNRSWFGERTDKTLQFLKDHGLTYVSVDGPRSWATMLPAVTSPTAVFRLHGRSKQRSASKKCDYLYNDNELQGIARIARAFNGRADRVHLAMNNNRHDFSVINGLKLKEMLVGDWHPPDRQALIEELEERRSASKTTKKHRGHAA
jgi:uncharacterized protein YecE (DUF72 family)